jgi:hypothetical protein
MAWPSFGPGEIAAPRNRGDTPSPFTGRAGEGLAGELLNITHTSLVAVSQDAGKKGAIMLTPACCLGHPSVGRELRCFALSMTC